MRVKVRQAVGDELDSLAEMVIDFREEHSRLIGGDKIVDREEVLEEVRRRLSDKQTGYFVAVSPEEGIVGYRSWEHRDDFYFTKELFVKPDWRRRGVAKEIIEKMESWLVDKGQDMACISCVPQNIAMIELARSEGYKVLNRIELRKELAGDGTDARDRERALGYEWDIL